VLPEGFNHVGGTYRTYGHGEPVDVWSVLTVPREEHPRFRFSHYFNVVGRVRENVGSADMEEDLRTAGVSVAKRYPAPNSPWKPRAVPLKEEIVGTADSTLLVLAGASAPIYRGRIEPMFLIIRSERGLASVVDPVPGRARDRSGAAAGERSTTRAAR
jgi:hypothetical protein